MKPILYESTEREFKTNGIGRLSDAITCYVSEERNGAYTLEMEYPLSGKHYEDLSLSRIILAKPEPGKQAQPFEIKSISRPFGGKVTVDAVHISYMLSSIPVMPFTANSCSAALDGLKANAAEPCPFTVWTDKNVAGNYELKKPQSFRACLGGTDGSLLDVYGTAEYEFDRFDVKMYLHRGTDRGVVIRYGKNLTDLKQEESIENMVTGICPYWTGTVDNKTVTVTLPEKVIQSDEASKSPYHRTVTVDLSQEITLPEDVTQPTVETLRAAAKSYMDTHSFGVPDVNLSVSYVDLADTLEYKGKASEQVNLCDTVTVKFDKLGVDARAKVISVEYDVLAERYNKIELGSYRSTLADTIYKNSQYKTDLENSIAASKIEQNKVRSMEISKALQESKDNANAQIKDLKNLEGYAFVHYNDVGKPYEFIVADSDDLSKAVNVWRWNQGGLAHSKTGYNGDYSDVAITQDGAIVADAISTGVLKAGLIKAGILQDVEGKNYWNLETGEFRLSSGAGIGNSTIGSVLDIKSAQEAAEKKAAELADNASSLAEAAQKEADKKIVTFYQTESPSGASSGDLWIDTNDGNSLHRWNGKTWDNVQDNKMQAALTAANTAQSTADGKIVTYSQTTAPTGSDLTIGDLWFNPNDNNHLKRWNGSSWVEARDGYIDEAAQAVKDSFTQQEVFNRLTNNGAVQGIYLKDGDLYINGSYIKAGTLDADLIKTGSLLVGGTNRIGEISLYHNDTKFGVINSFGLSLETNLYGSGIAYTMTPNTLGGFLVGNNKEGSGQSAVISPSTIVVKNNSQAANSWGYGNENAVAIDVNSGGPEISLSNGKVGVYGQPGISLHGDGSFTASGTKSRLVYTEDYSARKLYCYETPSPLFGDVGEGIIGEDGLAYIQIEPAFAETVNTSQYQVFLQKYGDGECYIKERKSTYFVTSGTPGLSFGWEIKAKQNDFDQYRLEEERFENESREKTEDYGGDASNHIRTIKSERSIV